MIHPVVGTDGDIVVVVQEWPCWLPVALAWGLPVMAVFVQARFRLLFAHLMEDTVVCVCASWSPFKGVQVVKHAIPIANSCPH
jgi:hypothetical protein